MTTPGRHVLPDRYESRKSTIPLELLCLCIYPEVYSQSTDKVPAQTDNAIGVHLDKIPSSSLTPLLTQESSDGRIHEASAECDNVNGTDLEKIPPSSLTPLATQQSADGQLLVASPSLPSSESSIEQTHDRDNATHSANQTLQKPRQLSGPEPPLTQRSNIRSSQRVAKDGEIYILNSDDDSDASLEDLDEIIYRRKSSPPPRPASPSSQNEPFPEITKRRDLKRKVANTPASVRSPPRFSLKDLVAQSKRYEASREEIARINSMVEAQSKQRNGKRVSENEIVEGLMRERGEEDDMDRLKLAIQRTEVLHQELTWTFFDEKLASMNPPEIPGMESCGLGPLLSKPFMRKQSFLSGYVEDFAIKDHLPYELINWILEMALHEPRDDLRQSYLNVLRQSSEQVADILTKERLTSLFRSIGASSTAIQIDEPIEPRICPSENQLHTNRASELLPLLELLHTTAATMNSESLTHAVCLTCRSLLDTSITSDGYLLTRTEHLLTELLSQLLHPDHCPSQSPSFLSFRLLTVLYSTTSNPQLRVQLLRNLPLLSRPWLTLRRRLALSWFLSTPPTPMSPAFSLSAITSSLSTPPFILNNATNFAQFTSSIQILDISLDSCDRPPSLPSTKHPSLAHQNYETPLINPHAQAAAKHFDTRIDALATKLRTMFLSIIDSGASDLRRTEAKEALEGLRARLLYSVRTRPPPRKRMFREMEEKAEERMRRGINGWVKAEDADTSMDLANGVVNGEA